MHLERLFPFTFDAVFFGLLFLFYRFKVLSNFVNIIHSYVSFCIAGFRFVQRKFVKFLQSVIFGLFENLNFSCIKIILES